MTTKTIKIFKDSIDLSDNLTDDDFLFIDENGYVSGWFYDRAEIPSTATIVGNAKQFVAMAIVEGDFYKVEVTI